MCLCFSAPILNDVLFMPEPMQHIIEDPLMRHSVILVFANKQDLVR